MRRENGPRRTVAGVGMSERTSCQLPGGVGSVPLFSLVNMHNLWGGSLEDDPAQGSVINQLQACKKTTTLWPDSAAYTLNTRKINATSNQSVNKRKKSRGGERGRGRRWRRGPTQTPVIRNRALTRIITLSVVNKAKHEPGPTVWAKDCPQRWDLPNFSLQKHWRNRAPMSERWMYRGPKLNPMKE